MINNLNEIWLPVVGYEGFYEISNKGEVRSIQRMIITSKGIRTIRGRKLKTRINNDGYVDVRLSKEGKTKTTFIHILLAKAFISNKGDKMEVNHINGIKTDNNISNLEWVSHSQNMIHAYKMGLIKFQKKTTPVINIFIDGKTQNSKKVA